jgi:hypothetical protein
VIDGPFLGLAYEAVSEWERLSVPGEGQQSMETAIDVWIPSWPARKMRWRG